MEQTQKKKTGRKKYLDDYVPDNNNKYIYKGEYYSFAAPSNTLRWVKTAYAAIAAAITAMYIAGGMVDMVGSRIIYVILPFVLMFLPLVFIVSDVIKIAAAPEKMTQKQYNRSVLQMKISSFIVLALICTTMIGDAVFILFYCPAEDRMGELPFLGYCAAVLVLDIILIRIQKIVVCRSEEAKKK